MVSEIDRNTLFMVLPAKRLPLAHHQSVTVVILICAYSIPCSHILNLILRSFSSAQEHAFNVSPSDQSHTHMFLSSSGFNMIESRFRGIQKRSVPHRNFCSIQSSSATSKYLKNPKLIVKQLRSWLSWRPQPGKI